jgi:biotin transport system substrate-specific component
MVSQALVPSYLSAKNLGRMGAVAATAAGIVLLAALAQIKIPLPFTPVPITGQTFGVALIALLWGRRMGTAIVAAYLAVGFMGIPVFASAAMGPTVGYLIGMVISAWIVGGLTDRGWVARGFFRAWAAALIGSVAIFGCGVAVLSAFIPADQLLMAGVFPFLPGDLIKTGLAAAIATGVSQSNWGMSTR